MTSYTEELTFRERYATTLFVLAMVAIGVGAFLTFIVPAFRAIGAGITGAH